jgi:hypothetical protein
VLIALHSERQPQLCHIRYLSVQTAVSSEADVLAISLLLQWTHAVHPMVLHAVSIHSMQGLASQALCPQCYLLTAMLFGLTCSCIALLQKIGHTVVTLMLVGFYIGSRPPQILQTTFCAIK